MAHTDWSARNVRVWPDGIRAIYDADSLSLVPESTAVGIAAATWSAFGEEGEATAPSPDEAARWVCGVRAGGSTVVAGAAACSGRRDPLLARLHGAVRARGGDRASRARTPAAGARPVRARRRPLRRAFEEECEARRCSVPRHDLAHPTRNDGAVRRPAARATSEVRGARRPRLHRRVVRRVRRRRRVHAARARVPVGAVVATRHRDRPGVHARPGGDGAVGGERRVGRARGGSRSGSARRPT